MNFAEGEGGYTLGKIFPLCYFPNLGGGAATPPPPLFPPLKKVIYVPKTYNLILYTSRTVELTIFYSIQLLDWLFRATKMHF